MLSHQNIKIAFVAVVCLVACRFWSFHGFPDYVFDVLEVAASAALLVFYMFAFKPGLGHPRKFELPVLLFFALPFVSMISAAVFHEQSIALSIMVLRRNFFWLLYFTLHALQLSRKQLVSILIFVGSIWIAITILQQFTYPRYFFYTREDTGETEFMRAGVYRFMIDPYQYGLFLLLFFYVKTLAKPKLQYILWLVVGLAGFYYYGTRQLLVGIAATLGIYTLRQKGKVAIIAASVFVVLAVILVVFSDQLLGDYVEMTTTQIRDTDDIRLIAADFFLTDYWPSWITVVIGNGMEHNASPYGKEMVYINTSYHLYKSDVGIIGALNTYGAVYVCNIVLLFTMIFRFPLSEKATYLKLVFFFTALLLPISEQFSYPSAIPFYCVILYLMDISRDEEGSSDLAHIKS